MFYKYIYLKTKGELPSSTQSQSQMVNDNTNIDNSRNSHVNTKNNYTNNNTNNYGGQSNNNNTNNYGGQGFNDLQIQVLDIIRQGKPVIGVSTNEVITKLPDYDPKDIKQALRFLFDEGHLYNTSNFDNYSATD